MSGFLPSSGNPATLFRLAAQYLNPLLQGYTLRRLAAAPSGVEEGFTYYDLALKKVRTWDGAAWHDHY